MKSRLVNLPRGLTRLGPRLSSVFAFVGGLIFVLVFLALGYFGFHGLRTGALPNGRHEIRWGDKRLSVEGAGVLFLAGGAIGALIVFVAVVLPHVPRTDPEARADVGPVVAKPVQPVGPWEGSSNGVKLEVATVDYGPDHLAQVRIRMVNTSHAAVRGEDWFSVVDNLGRARNADAEQSSVTADLELAPGETFYGRGSIAYTWAPNSERFDVRANLHYANTDQHFDVVSAGVPIPVEQRVGG